MQWSPAINAGFSIHTPWLPVNEDYLELNVKVESRNPDSILNLYRSLIFLRNDEVILQSGDWVPVINGEKGILAYSRVLGKEQILVLLNFRNRTMKIPVPFPVNGYVLISTHRWGGSRLKPVEDIIFPYEATVLRMNT